MNKFRKLWRKHFGPTDVDVLSDAINRVAAMKAEVEACRVKGRFYRELLEDINHETNWWAFANVKQKQFDNHSDFLLAQSNAENATAWMEGVSAELKL